ncbi:MAG: ABC-type dipeptide transport system, periplasmic component [Candidatus Moranbacteria bacterium GW2011_GWF2_36_839]|nr:MAG: ABC-type dipeptide transport system, periplasmic component [Candidatus Moranbacteria bacterium GW2011_GWF1_36_78]KKQ17780.1 MAG: ABC-type dipeptide transport system, periplasmic component [Candidatus Moranbacteria bacterium GW2011_GWF2_36_839]HAT73482.1 hypothetical protein [Candidatus Moranbacteria bacterium]HBY10844.1 hypothetical protein [Candidatus Moranbacteria bacterium]
MNQKNIIAILGVAVVILLGTTIYFATISNVSQPAPVPVVKQPATPAPIAQTPATPANQQPVATQPTTTSQKVESNEEIAKRVLGFIEGKNTIKIEKTDADHIVGTKCEEPSAADKAAGRDIPSCGYFYLAKTNGNWQKVLEGNGVIKCNLLKQYNFTGSMLNGCIN